MIWSAVTPKFLIVQAIVASVFVATLWQGWPQYMIAADATYITVLICALAIGGVVCVGIGRYGVAEYLIEALPRCGLFGTAVGIAIVAANSGGDYEAILGGMSTAFMTTIAGLLGSEWIRVSKRLK